MKIRFLIILTYIILNIPLCCYADAPMETYFFGREQISDDILRETKAVLTVSIIDPKVYAEYYQQSEVKNAPYISTFKKEKGSFRKIGVLDKAEIKTPTGGKYGGSAWYRFPVITKQGAYLEIVYNLPQNKKCWVNLSELTFSLSGEEPVLEWFTNQESSQSVSVDIFFLSRNKEIKLYSSPSPGSSSRIVTPHSEILRTHGSYDVRAFKIVQRKNGFGRLVEIQGFDMPARKIGWIRLRDENGLLLVWPIMGNL